MDFNPTESFLPDVLDHYALVQPDAIYAEYPISPTSYDDGFFSITYRELSLAVNALASWLVGTLGTSTVRFQKLAYFGPNDIRYTALTLGALKAGYSMFFPSPRNSPSVNIQLLARVDCQVILSPQTQHVATTSILEHDDSLRVLEVPEVAALIAAEVPTFSSLPVLKLSPSDPLVTIHTSGTTDIPKPMTMTHETATRGMDMFILKPPVGFRGQNEMLVGKRIFLVLPPFHGAYIAFNLMNAIPFDTVTIAPISNGIPSASRMVDALRHTTADIAVVPPSILEDLSRDTDLLDYCADHLSAILFCGGSLAETAGDIINARIPLYNQYGSTELGATPQILSLTNRSPGDWKYVQFHPDLGCNFDPISDDQCELVSIRKASDKYQLPFSYPGRGHLKQYRSGDLFTQHPDPGKPELWTWHSRCDDILVLSNGEKTNPVAMERHIYKSSQEVKGALVLGSQRFQPTLLIDYLPDGLEPSDKGQLAALTKIWPVVAEANEKCPAYARIDKSHIIFADRAKPFKRSPKGTIQRAATAELYKSELDALYGRDELSHMQVNSGYLEQTSSPSSVRQFLRDAIKAKTGWTELEDEEDLFARGMDSLQTLSLVRFIQKELNFLDVSAAQVYENGSVKALTESLLQNPADRHNQADEKGTEGYQTVDISVSNVLREFESMIDRIPAVTSIPVRPKTERVVLTDSLDKMGPFILDCLLDVPSVEHVFCLNSRVGNLSTQTQEQRRHNLNNELTASRVTVLKVDLDYSNWNLPSQIYNELLENVTLVFHNAWPVQLNWSLASFRPQLYALVNILTFCEAGAKSPRLFSLTPFGALFGYADEHGEVPERTVPISNPQINGYVASRCVGEQLLDYAQKRLHFQISISRLAHISPPVQAKSAGDCNDWVAALVVQSVQMGVIPASLGVFLDDLNWIPVDLISPRLVELALFHTSPIPSKEVQVFNFVNLNLRRWGSAVSVIVDEVWNLYHKRLEVISLPEWIDAIHRKRAHVFDPATLSLQRKLDPALMFTDFYDRALVVEGVSGNAVTSKLESCLPPIGDIPPIQDEWLRKWLREWKDAYSNVC